MSEIQEHVFDDHIQGAGLYPFNLDLTYDESFEPVDLTGATIIMQLRNSLDLLGWEFSTREEGNTTISGNDQGVIQFPQVDSWNIPPSLYSYDVKIIDETGFVTYALKGTWKILPRISRET